MTRVSVQTLPQTLWLHLMPGAVLTLLFVLLAPALPTVPAILVFFGVAAVLVPTLELGYLLLQGKRQTGAWTLRGVLRYNNQLERRDILPLLGVFILAFIMLALTTPLAAWLLEQWRTVLPPYFVFAGVEQFVALPKPTLWLIFAVWIGLNGLLLPCLEELYFRGFLLPRLEQYGKLAPFVSTLLFAVYHFWQPWNYPTIVLGLYPVVWYVWRRQSVYCGIVVHCALNTCGAFLTFGQLLA
jgi:uncharacterized protein